jgi:outer membrane protein TolC
MRPPVPWTYIGIYLFEILMLFFCVVGKSACDTIPKEINLEQAIAIALKNNISVQVLEQDVDIAQSKITEAVANRNPDTDLQLRYRYLDTDLSGPATLITDSETISPGLFRGNVFTTRLTIDTKLFSWIKNSRLLESSELDSKLQELNLRKEQRDLIKSVIDHYYNVLVNKKLLESALSQQQGAMLQLEQAERLFNSGMAAHYDVLRARVQKANIESLRLNREKTLADSLEQLRVVLGIAEAVNLQPLDEIKIRFPEFNQQKLLQQALENRIEIQKINTQLDKGQKTIEFERSGETPQLEAIFEYNLFNPDNSSATSRNFRSDRHIIAGGVSLTVPLFTGTTRDAKVSQAQSEYTKDFLKKDELIKTTKSDLSRIFQELRNLRQIIEGQEENIKFAKEGLRIAMLRYERGNGTNLEVIDSQTALAVSEGEYLQSVKSYISTLAELGSIISDDSRELLKLALTHTATGSK